MADTAAFRAGTNNDRTAVSARATRLAGFVRLPAGSSLQRALEHAAHLANATILFSHFHHFGEGGGVTGVLLLAESHISIHTWVEHRFAAVDIFLCGQKNPQTAAQFLQQALHAEHTVWHCRARGTHITS